jgi:hypothetical protein
MCYYWINPAGELFEVDDAMCIDIVDKPKAVIDANRNRWINPFDYVPNGKHGKISPVDITAMITIYPSIISKEEMDDWPEAQLFIRHGRIKEVIDVRQRPIWKPSQHTEP